MKILCKKDSEPEQVSILNALKMPITTFSSQYNKIKGNNCHSKNSTPITGTKLPTINANDEGLSLTKLNTTDTKLYLHRPKANAQNQEL